MISIALLRNLRGRLTVAVSYPYAGGTNLLDGKTVAKAGTMTIGPWDLAIVEER